MPAVFVHTAEPGVELEPTPAETSQEASGERLSGKVDLGSNGVEPREGPRRTGRGGGQVLVRFACCSQPKMSGCAHLLS